MEQEKTTPITMRLPEEKLNLLKEVARKKSMDENRDIAYSDIIRNLIDECIKKNSLDVKTKLHNEDDNLPTYNHINDMDDFHSLLTYNIADSIAGKNNIVVKNIIYNMCGFLKKNSIPRQVLFRDEIPCGGEPKYDNDDFDYFGGKTLVISLRGAIPEKISQNDNDNDNINIPTFMIACSPSLYCGDNTGNKISGLNKYINMSIKNITKEENINFINLLYEATKTKSEGLNIHHLNRISLVCPKRFYEKIQNNTVNISDSDYVNRLCKSASQIFDSSYEDDCLFIINSPKDSMPGIMPIYYPTIFGALEPKKIKASLVIAETIGMCINTKYVYKINLQNIDY